MGWPVSVHGRSITLAANGGRSFDLDRRHKVGRLNPECNRQLGDNIKGRGAGRSLDPRDSGAMNTRLSGQLLLGDALALAGFSHPFTERFDKR